MYSISKKGYRLTGQISTKEKNVFSPFLCKRNSIKPSWHLQVACSLPQNLKHILNCMCCALKPCIFQQLGQVSPITTKTISSNTNQVHYVIVIADKMTKLSNVIVAVTPLTQAKLQRQDLSLSILASLES